jgi:hypothetical protein
MFVAPTIRACASATARLATGAPCRGRTEPLNTTGLRVARVRLCSSTGGEHESIDLELTSGHALPNDHILPAPPMCRQASEPRDFVVRLDAALASTYVGVAAIADAGDTRRTVSGKRVYAGGLRIGTRCETVDEFVDKFYRYCVGSMIFIPSAKRSVGRDVAFSFDLTEGRPVLCGVGVVMEQFPDASNPFGRAGIVIEIRQLQADSRPVLEKLATMQRMRRGGPAQARETTPPPATPAPISPRTLTSTPSHRSRAVTAAIEIDSAIAIAKESAAQKSGGHSHVPTPIAAAKPIPSIVRGGRAATAGAATSPRKPAGSWHESSQNDEPASVDAAPLPPNVVDQVSWDVSRAFDVPSGAIAVPQPAQSSLETVAAFNEPASARAPAAARLVAAARHVAREVTSRWQLGTRTFVQGWRLLPSPSRWLAAGSAGAAGVALFVIALVSTSTQTPAPMAASEPVTSPTGSAGDATEPIAEPPPQEPVKKPAVKKQKRVATKRVATKPKANKPIKKTVAKQPIKKPVAKQPIKKPVAKQPIKKPVAKQPIKKPVAKQPIKKTVAKQPSETAPSPAPRTSTTPQ